MRIQGKHKKTAKRRLMKELRWGKKKWKTHVSVPRRSSMRSLGTRHRSSLQDPLDGMAPEEVDENVIPSFSPLNSLTSSDGPFDFGDRMGAEGGLSVEHETLQAEGTFSTVYETSQARGVILQASTENSAGPAETELAPFMEELTSDSGVVTVEHFEDSYVEVTQYSRDRTTRAAGNHEARAARSEARAAHNNEGRAARRQAARNQRLIIIQQEVAEADDISIGNPQPDDVDLRARRLTRSYYRRLENCATCFQRPRQTFNLPCTCFCNCLECDRVMINCSMCQRPIRASIRCSLAT